jgi:hypothetical protein
MRRLFILLEFLYWWNWRSTGTNKPRQAIYFDSLLSMFLVEIFLSLVSWFLASPWVCLTWFFYILATKCVMSPLDILRTCSKYVNHISPPFDTLILVNTWDNIIKIALLFGSSPFMLNWSMDDLDTPSCYDGNHYAIIHLSSHINFRLGKPSRFYLVVKVFVKTLGIMLCPSENLRKERIW